MPILWLFWPKKFLIAETAHVISWFTRVRSFCNCFVKSTPACLQPLRWSLGTHHHSRVATAHSWRHREQCVTLAQWFHVPPATILEWRHVHDPWLSHVVISHESVTYWMMMGGDKKSLQSFALMWSVIHNTSCFVTILGHNPKSEGWKLQYVFLSRRREVSVTHIRIKTAWTESVIG